MARNCSRRETRRRLPYSMSVKLGYAVFMTCDHFLTPATQTSRPTDPPKNQWIPRSPGRTCSPQSAPSQRRELHIKRGKAHPLHQASCKIRVSMTTTFVRPQGEIESRDGCQRIMTVEQDGSGPPSASGAYVQSLARGLNVIRAFSDEHPRQTISDIARRCSLSRPAARRFLHTLVELGYVATDGTHYWLTPQVLELGSSYLSSLSLPDLAQPHLTELSATINESSSVCILDGFDIVYVARVQVRRIMSVTILPGTRMAAAGTAMGRVLLAGLPAARQEEYLRTVPLESYAYTSGTIVSRDELAVELRRVKSQGYCIVDHSHDYRVRSVAAPIRSRNGDTVAGVQVSAPSITYSESKVRDHILPLVLATADKISVDVAHTQLGLININSS